MNILGLHFGHDGADAHPRAFRYQHTVDSRRFHELQFLPDLQIKHVNLHKLPLPAKHNACAAACFDVDQQQAYPCGPCTVRRLQGWLT